jgi:hypothetical protein
MAIKAGSIYEFRETDDSYGLVFEPSTDDSGTFSVIAEGDTDYKFTFDIHTIDHMIHTLRVIKSQLQKKITIDELWSNPAHYFTNYLVFLNDRRIETIMNKSADSRPSFVVRFRNGSIQHVEPTWLVVLEKK